MGRGSLFLQRLYVIVCSLILFAVFGVPPVTSAYAQNKGSNDYCNGHPCRQRSGQGQQPQQTPPPPPQQQQWNRPPPRWNNPQPDYHWQQNNNPPTNNPQNGTQWRRYHNNQNQWNQTPQDNGWQHENNPPSQWNGSSQNGQWHQQDKNRSQGGQAGRVWIENGQECRTPACPAGQACPAIIVCTPLASRTDRTGTYQQDSRPPQNSQWQQGNDHYRQGGYGPNPNANGSSGQPGTGWTHNPHWHNNQNQQQGNGSPQNNGWQHGNNRNGLNGFGSNPNANGSNGQPGIEWTRNPRWHNDQNGGFKSRPAWPSGARGPQRTFGQNQQQNPGPSLYQVLSSPEDRQFVTGLTAQQRQALRQYTPEQIQSLKQNGQWEATKQSILSGNGTASTQAVRPTVTPPTAQQRGAVAGGTNATTGALGSTSTSGSTGTSGSAGTSGSTSTTQAKSTPVPPQTPAPTNGTGSAGPGKATAGSGTTTGVGGTASNTTGSAPSASGGSYTFQKQPDGTLAVYQNGKLVSSSASPDAAAKYYGYTPSSPTTSAPVSSAPAPYTFVENYLGSQMLTVGVYQNGKLVAVEAPDTAAANFGYRSGENGAYSAFLGASATNLKTKSEVLSFPQTSDDLNAIAVPSNGTAGNGTAAGTGTTSTNASLGQKATPSTPQAPQATVQATVPAASVPTGTSAPTWSAAANSGSASYTIPGQNITFTIPANGQVFRTVGDTGDAVYARVGNQLYSLGFANDVQTMTGVQAKQYVADHIPASRQGQVGNIDPNGVYVINASGLPQEMTYTDLRNLGQQNFAQQTGIQWSQLPTYNLGDVQSAFTHLGSSQPHNVIDPNFFTTITPPNAAAQQNYVQTVSPNNPQGAKVTTTTGQVVTDSPSLAANLAKAGGTPQQIQQATVQANQGTYTTPNGATITNAGQVVTPAPAPSTVPATQPQTAISPINQTPPASSSAQTAEKTYVTPSGAVVTASGQLVQPPPSPTPATATGPNPSTGSSGTTGASAPATGSSKTYTFQTTSSGTIAVFQNGQRISTTTPENAALTYGYKPPTSTSSPPNTSTQTPSTQSPSQTYSVATPQPYASVQFGPTTSTGATQTSPVNILSGSTTNNNSYTFQTTADGNVAVFKNGQRITTTTAQNAALNYGYSPSPNTTSSSALNATASTSNAVTSNSATTTSSQSTNVAPTSAKVASPSSTSTGWVTYMSPNIAVTPQHADNCVYFLSKDMHVSLPGGLFTYADKYALPHVQGPPKKGDVAIIKVTGKYADEGHVALVTDVTATSITIVEANFYQSGAVDSRISTASSLQAAEQKLHITAFYRPPGG
ncbi:MAG: hypothetical protein KGJ49_04925 [Alphaproteobacteria bacterium]|nr:hypothetical protein [Alphaproteobacteria bacterium]